MILSGRVPRLSVLRAVFCFIDVKKRFYVFYFGHVFYVFNVFYFPNVFYLKNVGKVELPTPSK